MPSFGRKLFAEWSACVRCVRWVQYDVRLAIVSGARKVVYNSGMFRSRLVVIKLLYVSPYWKQKTAITIVAFMCICTLLNCIVVPVSYAYTNLPRVRTQQPLAFTHNIAFTFPQRRTYAPHAYCILCVDHRHNACANINTKLAAHVREQRTGDARAMRRFDLAAPGQTRQFMGRRVCGAWARAEIARNLNIFNNVLSPNDTNAHAHTRTTHTQHMCVGMLGRFGAGRFKIDRSCWCVWMLRADFALRRYRYVMCGHCVRAFRRRRAIINTHWEGRVIKCIDRSNMILGMTQCWWTTTTTMSKTELIKRRPFNFVSLPVIR